MPDLDTVLEHFGIRGMHWGVRRSKAELSGPTPVIVKVKPGQKIVTKGGKGYKPVEEAINAAVVKQRAKSSGVQSLSNQELQAAVNRMNLEQSYTKLNPKKLSFGQKATNELLYGDTPNMAIAGAKPLFATKIATELAASATSPASSRTKTGLDFMEAVIKARPKKKK
jgi:hypothetical protein